MSVALSEVRKCEAFLLNCAEDSNDTPIGLKNVQHILQGEFCKVLESPLCQEIFCAPKSFQGSIEDSLLDCVREFVGMTCTATDQLDVLCVGIASLQAFLQSNWTGPLYKGNCEQPLPWLASCYQPNGHPLVATKLARLVIDCLDLDGEGLCKVTEQPELLVLARAVFRAELPHLNVSRGWWLLRCLLTHQRMLHETAPQLHSEMRRLADELSGCEDQLTSSASAQALLHLEMGSMHVYYGDVVRAEQQVRAAAKLLNLAVSLVGAIGKRTRFQEKSLAQLTVQVNVEHVEDILEEDYCCLQDMPKVLDLDDDVRLNQIAFSNEADGKFPVLNAVEQAMLIALYSQTLISRPVDKLQNEELLPYLVCVLSRPQVWSIQMAALFFRSGLESKERRTVERAMMQVQEIVDTFDSSEAKPELRLRFLFCSQMPPRWRLETLLGSILVSLNLVRSALDVYLRLQSWPEVVSCYTKLQLRHKAAEVLKQELAKGETPRLWCMLGDATDDPDCYEKAWMLSEERSGQAQRHWGMHFYSKKQYAEAIPHLERSLSINSLQIALWSHLGFAALVEERWELCASAYHRYCSLEPEAWNNLAKAYVKLGQKARAYRALQEAVKCNYENWRVWDNLMAVSTDCGDFEEVIRCYHRILDLHEKHVDQEVLQILVHAIEQNLSDNRGEPIARHSKKALTLFGRLTTQVTGNSTLWRLYAQLTVAIGEQTTETYTRRVQYLLAAHRCATQAVRWAHEFQSCLNVVEICAHLTEACLICWKQDNAPGIARQMLVSTRFALKGAISLIKKHHEDISGEMAPELVDGMNLLRAKLKLVETEMNISAMNKTFGN